MQDIPLFLLLSSLLLQNSFKSTSSRFTTQKLCKKGTNIIWSERGMYEASYGLHSFSTISHKTMAWTTCIPFNIIHTHTNTHRVLTDMKLNEKKKKNTLSEILFMSCERVTCMNCVAHTHYKYFVVVFFFCHFDATTYHCCCCWSSLVLEYVFNGFKKTCISLKRFKSMGIDVKLTDVDCVSQLQRRYFVHWRWHKTD